MDMHMNLGLQYGLRQWAMGTKVLSGGSMDHGGFSMGFNSENEPIFILEVVIQWLGSMFRG